MTSITQQKSDLRAIIHRRIETYLDENPDAAHRTAMGAIRRLSAKMTLSELEQWHQSLFMSLILRANDNESS